MQGTQQNNPPLGRKNSAGEDPIREGRSTGFPVNYKARVNFIRILFGLLFIPIVVKLGFVQGVRGFYYQQVAQKQYESRVPLRANRGMVYDRNGGLIISNNYGYSYAADPQLLSSTDEKEISERFSAVFNRPPEFFSGKMDTKKGFVWLARSIDSNQVASLRDLNIYGLIRLQQQQRFYPYGSVAGQVLGYTDIDGKGASGIELEFDSLLAGKDGYEIMQRDGIGRRMPSVDYPRVDPVPGCNLQLTIDLNIQQIVDEELAAGVEGAKASAGSAVFMNPNTGEILAIANYPQFSPSDYTKYSLEDIEDRAITDAGEPGSTFKIVSACAALEEGVEKPDDLIFAENGKYTLHGRVVEDFEHAGWVTFRQALELSSNIAFSKVGMKIPPEKFYRYARDFGFGAATGIELPAESPGQLKKPFEWSKISEPFMAFGYEVMVTSLQMTQAYAAIANGGILMKPYIVSKATDSRGNVVFQNSPAEIRRVVSPEVAQALTGLFVDVVEHGTGLPAKINDLLMAGKTGTAQKLIDGEYSKRFYRASFAGFFPVPNPAIVGFIMIDSPMNGYTGGGVAAPIFKKIATRIYGIMQRRTTDFSSENDKMASSTPPPSQKNRKAGVAEPVRNPSGKNLENTTDSRAVMVPDVSFLGQVSAAAILENSGLVAPQKQVGNGFVVWSQKPDAGELVPKGSTVQINLVDAQQISKMPDFHGASIRKATSFLLAAGIQFHVAGSGKVLSQSPNPGSPINKKSVVVINCENKSLNALGTYK